MSATENKEFLHRYLAAISGKPKPAAVLDLYMTDAHLKAHIAAAEEGFPEYEMEAIEVIAEGDKIALKARLKGTHLGPFNGIPATGRKVNLLFHITYEIQAGKISDHWLLMDGYEFMQQLGVLPA